MFLNSVNVFTTFMILTVLQSVVQPSPLVCHNVDSMGHVKGKSAFEYVQNAPIQIIIDMRKVSPGPLFSIHNSIVSNDTVSGICAV